MINETYIQEYDLDKLSPEQIKEIETRNKLEQKLLLLEELKNRKRLKNIKSNYLEYLKAVNVNFKVGKHISYITNKVESFLEQKEKKYLIISMPPQHGKSMALTEALPSWYLLNHMDDGVIIASYNERFASRFGKKNRNKLKECSELYDFELDGESVVEFGIKDHTGVCISRGIMSGITGNPADLIIIDDPIKNRKEAESKNKRDSLYAEWLDTLNTRLSAKGKMIIILTRWHDDDLAGKIIKEFPDLCDIVNIPCEAEENDILGREVGDSLFPEIGKDKNWLATFKKIYCTKEGNRSWYSLYQGKPLVDGGNYIKRKDIRRWNKATLPSAMHVMCMSIDAAFKDNQDNDDVAIQIWGKHNADFYLLDKVSGKMSFTKTIQMIAILKNKWKDVSRIYIEDKANGPAIISVLKDKIEGIIPVEPQGSKVSRLLSVTGLFEAGNIYIPEDAEWAEEYIEQLIKFPAVAHDDDVDATSQALFQLMFIVTEIQEIINSINDPYKFNNNLVSRDEPIAQVTPSFLNYK